MDRPASWRCEANELACREWDGELVVYNDADGNTHHLAPLGSELLRVLLHHRAGMETPALIDAVAAKYGAADVSARQVENALEELARLELIIRDPA